jgi:hypothetical protein
MSQHGKQGLLNDLKGIAAAIIKYPTSFAVWAQSLEVESRGINEIVIIGKEAVQKQKEMLKNIFLGRFYRFQ